MENCKTQTKLEWRKVPRIVIGQGSEMTLEAHTDTTPVPYRFRYDDIGIIKIAKNLNKKPCLWIKQAGGNWQFVSEHSSQDDAKRAANDLFGIVNERHIIKVDHVCGHLYYVLDTQCEHKDHRAKVASSDSESQIKFKCDSLNGKYDHVGKTPPPFMG